MIKISPQISVTLFTLSTLVATPLLANDSNLMDKSLEGLLGTNIQTKAQVGSRDISKNYLESSSPVDVITLENIRQSGVTNLTSLLNYFISSFTVSRSSISDGMDHIVQYSLRGMRADQILVLVNGKRFHSSSLVSTSEGTSFVDLNAIPLVAVNRVEVLRDGAAAQYGSDAIAGVINIILKTKDVNSLSIHSGKRQKGDGDLTQVDAFYQMPLDYDGFVNLSMSAKAQSSTNRAGLDRRISSPRVTTHYGIPESDSFGVVLNSEVVSPDNDVFYSTLLVNYNESEASTFFRIPDEERPLYPEGFLPMLKDSILDYSLTFGMKGQLAGGISWDLSNIYGVNRSEFSLSNSMNYDLAEDSPTQFFNGKLITKQNVTNLDLKKSVNDFVLSAGLEYRFENYQVKSGDSASYYATGSQGFPGYGPNNEVDADRRSQSLYIDTLYSPSEKFTANLALRYENYSDFGETTNYKFSTKYQLTPQTMLRATTSTGFRAPSMSQQNYSYTSSSLNGDTLTMKGIFQPQHPASRVLGATDLKAEKSQHYSVGLVYQPNNHSAFMVDPFLVTVNDRILLSDRTGAVTDQQQAIFDQYQISGVQYFSNVADLKTHGVDIKYNQLHRFKNSHSLETTLWYHFSQVSVKNSAELSALLNEDLEKSRPQEYLKLLNIYQAKNLAVAFNINHFGHFYRTKGADTTKFTRLTTADLDIAYRYNKHIQWHLGGFNIFNTIPNKWDRSNKYFGYDGIMPYSQRSPVDYSGAYYYLRMSMQL